MTMAVAGSTVWMAQPVWGQELAKERADLYFQEGKLNFETKNKAFRMKLDNRIYTDLSFYLPTVSVDGLSSKPNKDMEEDDGKFRFDNGVSIRRPVLRLRRSYMRNGLPNSTWISPTMKWR